MDCVVCLTSRLLTFEENGSILYNYLSGPSPSDPRVLFVSHSRLDKFAQKADVTFAVALAYRITGQLVSYFLDLSPRNAELSDGLYSSSFRCCRWNSYWPILFLLLGRTQDWDKSTVCRGIPGNDLMGKVRIWRRGGFELPARIDSMEVIEFPKRTKRCKLQKSGFEIRNRNARFPDRLKLCFGGHTYSNRLANVFLTSHFSGT